jgi:phospholipid transport system substrate-binding protein
MNRSLARGLALLAALTFAGPALANEAVVKPLKTVVGSVRYGKDLAALKHFAAEEQGRLLLGEEWGKATEAQRKEFSELFGVLFAKLAFPKVRQNFEHLETVLYDAPKVEGDKAEVGSTIVILHPMKKQELRLRYQLVKDKAAWKVVDVTVLGDSMLKGIRDDQIKPIMAEGGWDNLLTLMRAKVKELEKVPLK